MINTSGTPEKGKTWVQKRDAIPSDVIVSEQGIAHENLLKASITVKSMLCLTESEKLAVLSGPTRSKCSL